MFKPEPYFESPIYMSIFKGVTCKIENQTQKSKSTIAHLNVSELPCKVSGPWDFKQESFTIRSGAFWAFLGPFFTTFRILGRYKKIKRETLSKFVPLPEASSFPFIISKTLTLDKKYKT